MNITSIKQLNETSLSLLDIVVSLPSQAWDGEDYWNLYIQNDSGDDLYIGELKDIRLTRLVWAVPAVVEILEHIRDNPTGDDRINSLAIEILGDLAN